LYEVAQSGGKKKKRKGKSGQSGGGGSDAKKALFLRKRGKQAQREGRLNDAVQDLRKAAELVRGAHIDPKKRQSILKDAAFAEHQIGKTRKAIKIMHEAAAIRPNPTTQRGLAYMYASQGDIERAREASEKAKRIIQQIFMTKRPSPMKRLSLEAESHRMDAFLLEIQGRWAEAEEYLHKEIETLSDSGKTDKDPSLKARRNAGLARNLVKQGRLREAEVVARTAFNEALDKVGTDNSVTGDIARKLASTLAAQGRAEDAEQTIRDAIGIYQNAGLNDRQSKLRGARRDLASILAFQAEWEASAEEFARVETVMKPEGFARMLGRTPSLAIALIKTGRTEEILPHLEDAHRNASQQFGEKHPRAALTRVTLAAALGRAGKHAEALAHFTSGIPLLLSKSRPIDDENATETAQERWKSVFMEAYIGLLADIRGTPLEKSAGIDAMEVAFQLADTARGRRVQSAIAASGARAMATKPELADLVRREQDSRKQTAALNALLAEVLSKPRDEQVADIVADLKARIDKQRDIRGDLMSTIERRYPDYASLINPQPATVADAREALNSDEALVSFFVGEDRSFVWAVPGSGEAKFAGIDAGEEDIDDVVALIRGALEPNAETLGDIPPFDVETAFDAYQQLLQPVEDGWKSAPNLVVVAHGPLGWLPLAVLPTKAIDLAEVEETLFTGYRTVPWLVRDHAVSRVPSVSALALLRKLPPGKAERKPFAGFGDPLFNEGQKAAPASGTRAVGTGGVKTRGMVLARRAAPTAEAAGSMKLGALPRLPDTADEIRSIALALNADPSQTLFTGEKASEGFVKKADLSGFKVLAFAAHGLVPGELEGLQEPALALSSPEVAGGGDDGLLTMSEILALRLDADWVILSACNTGAAGGAGAEAVSGLGRAFFYAGTRSLLVSNWPVESASARKLTTELFRVHAAEPALPRAQALRKSMLSLIDGPGFVDGSGKSVFSYAHPLFWAPFSLIGDGGAGS